MKKNEKTNTTRSYNTTKRGTINLLKSEKIHSNILLLQRKHSMFKHTRKCIYIIVNITYALCKKKKKDKRKKKNNKCFNSRYLYCIQVRHNIYTEHIEDWIYSLFIIYIIYKIMEINIILLYSVSRVRGAIYHFSVFELNAKT